MAKKMSRRTLALSLSAITAVYLAGYVVTEPTAERIAAAEASGSSPAPPVSLAPKATVAATSTMGAPGPTVLTPTDVPATPVAASTPTARPAPRPTNTPAALVAGYRDGTYVGLGRSRRGDVEVTVTIQNGKIAAADISHCMTQYPQSVIDGLPDEVVVRQSARVDLVSGATYSSRAFQDAVLQALAKANSAQSTDAIARVESFA